VTRPEFAPGLNFAHLDSHLNFAHSLFRAWTEISRILIRILISRMAYFAHGLITPKALANASPGLLQPWDHAATNDSTLKGLGSALIPNVTFIVLDGMRLKKRTVLVLEGDALVMLFLIFDVPNNGVEIRLTN
jgi:hypothetical protein